MYDRKDEARDKFLNMDEYNRRKAQEITITETRLEQLKQDYEPYKAQDDINLLFELFPMLIERLRIAKLGENIGLTVDTIKKLFNGKPLSVTGNLYSSEHKQSFGVQDAKLQLLKEKESPDGLMLGINGKNIMD